jgi:hypothetical protein
MAEACKRLIKNCIKLAEIDDPAKREELLRILSGGRALECAS